MECIRHIRIGLGAANVNELIPLRSETNQIPFSIQDVFLDITFCIFYLNIKTITIVRPRAKFHGTDLCKKNVTGDIIVRIRTVMATHRVAFKACFNLVPRAFLRHGEKVKQAHEVGLV